VEAPAADGATVIHRSDRGVEYAKRANVIHIKLDYPCGIWFNDQLNSSALTTQILSITIEEVRSMDLPERDGDGYLIDMSQWTPEIGRAMAEADRVELDDTKWQHILKAREYFEEQSVVPPIRKFSKYCGEDQKAMFKLWMTGPMKPITKYGGLPKPTGCV
jgi:TusE/DsrC/DsvC family sulfur relay protein